MIYLLINQCCKIDVSNCTKTELTTIITMLESNNNDIQLKRIVE